MNKLKKILAFILIILIIFIYYATYMAKEKNHIDELNFLKTHASFSTYKDEFILQFDYFDNKLDPLLSDQHIVSIENKEITKLRLKKFEIVNIEKLGNINRKSLVLHLELADKTVEKAHFNSIYIDDIKHLLGDITIRKIEASNDSNLEIMRHSGLGVNLNQYSFEVLNTSLHDIEVVDILLNEFDKYSTDLEISINDTLVEKELPIKLEDKGTMLITIKFNSSKEYSSYVFNPVLKYKIEDKEYTYLPMRASYFLKSDYKLSK